MVVKRGETFVKFPIKSKRAGMKKSHGETVKDVIRRRSKRQETTVRRKGTLRK
jgi:hypothetical protein